MSSDKKRVHKKKKKVGELIADSVDNTAPVHKILEDLFQKNPPAYSLYSNVLKQRKTTKKHLQNYHFAVPGHPIHAFSEDWDGQLDSKFFEPFSHKSFPPKMINTMRNISKHDPVTEYLKIKHDWQRECKKYRRTVYKGKMIDKFEKFNEDVVSCPKHLVDLAALLDSDPDPCFKSSYNWYYAGNGNVQLVCIDWVDYLLHSELNCVYLTEFNKDEMKVNPDFVAKYECGVGSNILETICSSQHIVALRTRKKVLILRLAAMDEKKSFELLKIIESELPYTGISFDSYHKNILYVTTLDHNLNIVNLDRMIGITVKLKAKLHTLVDNWNTVIGTDRGFYTHIGKSSISLYDKRSNEASYLWTGINDVTDEMYCNDISIAKQSETAPIIYVGTDHHLFLMDLRYGDSQKVAAVQRWTHGMQCPPTYISKCYFDMNKDLVCLSSQWCEDMCVLPSYNQSRQDLDCNLTIPYRPPSILNALDEARINKLCNDLYNPIDSRLNTSITGCIVLEQGDKYEVLQLNSLGDLLCHTIFPEHLETFMEDQSSLLLHEWSKIYKLPRKLFEVTSVVDIASVWKKLKKVPESYMMGDMKSTMRDKNRFSEKEIFEGFEAEELDSGLLEAWTRPPEEAPDKNSSMALDLHYTDSE